LGSFCAFALRPGQIGFVLRIRPPAPAPGVFQSAIPNPQSCASGPQIGFVSHVSLSGRAAFHTRTPFAQIPWSTQVWLCFAHLPPGRVRMGLFCTFRLFVEPAPDRIGGCPGMQCRSAAGPPDIFRGRGQIGFVSHNYLRQPPAGGQNWVRFAPFTLGSPQLGSFCTQPRPRGRWAGSLKSEV
jgi:hypothetical protein